MAKKIRMSGISDKKMNPEINPQLSREDEEISIFDEENDKLIKREVDGEPDRAIRVGRDEDGKKFRYTDDTHEELVTKTTAGKNTYLTKSEFDNRVKEILMVDEIPEGIRAEFREGSIVFINEETGLRMSANELRSDERILAAQRHKKINDEYKPEAAPIRDVAQEEFKVPEINMKEIKVPLYSKVNERFMKVDPNWYTEEGVRNLEKEWGDITSRKSKGFNHQFYQGIVAISKELLCDPDNLMSLLNAESSLKPNDSVQGLMGFVGITRRKYNFSPQKLTPIQQLPYIRQYLVDAKKMAGLKPNVAMSPGILYTIVFTPGFLQDAMQDGRHILLSKRSSNPQKRAFYNNPINNKLDSDKKGYITIEDMAKRIEEKNALNTCKAMRLAYRGDRHSTSYTPKPEETLLAQTTEQPVNNTASVKPFDEPSIEELRKEYPNLIPEIEVTGKLSHVKNKKIAQNKTQRDNKS